MKSLEVVVFCVDQFFRILVMKREEKMGQQLRGVEGSKEKFLKVGVSMKSRFSEKVREVDE